MSDICIWLIGRTLSVTTTPGQSGPGSNDNKVVSYIPQGSKTGTSSSDSFVCNPGNSMGVVVLLLYRDAVGDWIFWWLGKDKKQMELIWTFQYFQFWLNFWFSRKNIVFKDFQERTEPAVQNNVEKFDIRILCYRDRLVHLLLLTTIVWTVTALISMNTFLLG